MKFQWFLIVLVGSIGFINGKPLASRGTNERRGLFNEETELNEVAALEDAENIGQDEIQPSIPDNHQFENAPPKSANGIESSSPSPSTSTEKEPEPPILNHKSDSLMSDAFEEYAPGGDVEEVSYKDHEKPMEFNAVNAIRNVMPAALQMMGDLLNQAFDASKPFIEEKIREVFSNGRLMREAQKADQKTSI